MKCDNLCCGRTLTRTMEIEHSHWLSEYYCSPDCATDRYFEAMDSLPATEEEKNKLFKHIKPKTIKRKGG